MSESSHMPTLSEDVVATLRARLERMTPRYPFVKHLWEDGAVPQLLKSEVADLARLFGDVFEDVRREFIRPHQADFTESMNEDRWVFVFLGARPTKSDRVKLARICERGDWRADLARRAISMQERWGHVCARLDLMRGAQTTATERRTAHRLAELERIPVSSRKAALRVAQMLDVACKDVLDEWQARYIPARVEEIVAEASKYERRPEGFADFSIVAFVAAQRGVAVQNPADAAVGDLRHAKLIRGHDGLESIEARRVLSATLRNITAIAQDAQRYFPLSRGLERARQEASAEAGRHRAAFLEKQSAKLSPCVEQIEALRVRGVGLNRGTRLSANIDVTLVSGGGFTLENECVFHWAPVSRYIFPQFPTRFTNVRLQADDVPKAMMSENQIREAFAGIEALSSAVAPRLPTARQRTTLTPSL